jgi:TonB family protein
MRRAFAGVCLALLFGFSCRADLTLRYTTDITIGSALPAVAATAMKQQMALNVPKERVIRIKGDKTLSDIGKLAAVVDNSGTEITLIDSAAKKYARLSMADFAAALRSNIPTIPAAAQQLMQNMKFDVHTSVTGQVGMVSGIRADEHLTTMTMSMDLPGLPATPAPAMRMEMHAWLASPDDLNRIPALRQYAAYAQRALSMINSADALQEVFSQLPGFGDMMRKAMEELTGNAGNLTVKTVEKVYSPLMARLTQNQADPNSPVIPDSPIIEMRTDLTTISSDAIDDSVFEVPADYELVSVAEIVKALMPAPVSASTATAPVPPSPDLGPDEQVTKVGAGVSPPAVIYKVDPEYSKEASKAKLSGTVTLSVVVDKEGTPRNIQVVEPLGMGLDEKAIEAVRQWKFRPGQKDGQPVNVRAKIQVNFRLVDRPPQQ